MVKILILITGVFFSQASFAWPPTFGPEFEFSNREVEAETINIEAKYAEKFRKEIKKKCRRPCKFKEDKTDRKGSKFTFGKGFWIRVAYDPGVVEVQMSPLTVAQLYKWKDTINEYIFETAKKLRLTPRFEGSGGHLNIGMKSAFGEDSELFLRFFTEFANLPPLSTGILGNDFYNAPTFATLSAEQKSNFYEILRDFKRAKNKPDPISLARQINQRVYVCADCEHHRHLDRGDLPSIKTQAMALRMIEGAERIEIRSMFAQRNVDDFIMLSELFEARIKYLSSKKGQPIVFKDPPDQDEYYEQDLVDVFYEYVTEAGLDYKRFRKLLRDGLDKIDPSPELVQKLKPHSPSLNIPVNALKSGHRMQCIRLFL